MKIFTIGHSNLDFRQFIKLLERHHIGILIDVRSQPFSAYNPQFNQGNLAAGLEFYNVGYRFMGDKLGGRPNDPALYLANGHADYGKMESTPVYQEGIDEVMALAERHTVVLMCSEGDYRDCHRHRLLGRTLQLRGVEVDHILTDGSTVAEEAVQLSLKVD